MRIFAALAFFLIGMIVAGAMGYTQIAMTNSAVWTTIVPAGYPRTIAELLPLALILGTIYGSYKIAVGGETKYRNGGMQ